jgi:hypothetical protein
MNRSKIANLGSQTGSQRHPIPGYASRQRTGISAGQRNISRHQPTGKYPSAVARNEQVVGSIPTGGSAKPQPSAMIGKTRSTGTRARAVGTARSVSSSAGTASGCGARFPARPRPRSRTSSGSCTPTWTRACRPRPATPSSRRSPTGCARAATDTRRARCAVTSGSCARYWRSLAASPLHALRTHDMRRARSPPQ